MGRHPGLGMVLSLCAMVAWGCERADPDAVLACTIFRETVCVRVAECSDLDVSQCEESVFADSPACPTALAAEGDVDACNDEVVTMSCDDFLAFDEEAAPPTSGACADTRFVFPR